MVKNFAHRGYSGKYPENTILAFKKAVQAGADGIELDVQLSKDGELVIIHDENLERTTGISGKVKDYYYEELREFNAAAKYDDYGFNPIPSLREYMEYIKDKDIITNVELKTDIIEYKGIEEKLLELIYEYDLKDRIIISSFNPNTMLRVRELDREIKCSILSKRIIRNPIEYIESLNMDGYHPIAYFIRARTVEKLRSKGIMVNIWTGERKCSLKRLLRLKSDGIITDYTEELNDLIK